jgi:hypothetical protein
MGAFQIEVPAGSEDNFNLHPAIPDPLPDDQVKISQDVYQAINVLKLLKAKGAFKNDDPTYKEFVTRIIQAARVGCTDADVHPAVATTALKDIRADILSRKGGYVVYRYLRTLALVGVVGIVVGAVLVWAANGPVAALAGYGWVVIGSMIGAWISVAVTQGRDVPFDHLQDYVERGVEPCIRMLFVGIFACVFALFLQLKILSLAIGDINFSDFATMIGLALALGVILGVGEKTLSVRLIDRAKDVVTTQ